MKAFTTGDLVVARLAAVVKGDRTQPKPGSMIQFSTDDTETINGEHVTKLK